MSTKLTVDGNYAAAHVAYAFSDVAGYLPHHAVVSRWRKLSTSGLRRAARTFSARKCASSEMQSEGGRGGRRARLSCRRRADHHVHRFSGSASDDPQHVQDRRRAASQRLPCHAPARLRLMRFPFSATIPTSWPAARPALRCWPPLPFRKSWTWRSSRIFPRIKARRAVPSLLRRLPHLSRRFRRSTSSITRTWQACSDWDDDRRLPRTAP